MILVTGANGFVGVELTSCLVEAGISFTASAKAKADWHDSRFDWVYADLMDPVACDDLLNSVQPDIIINLAAFTRIDDAETHYRENWRLNSELVTQIATWARSRSTYLIHVSSDYVFDGEHGDYTETSPLNPVNEYGKAKVNAESTIRSLLPDQSVILRTTVNFGPHPVKQNFITWCLAALRSQTPVRIITDQISCASYTPDIARTIMRLTDSRHTGVFHICGDEVLSRYDMIRIIAEISGTSMDAVTKAVTADLNQRAKRPMRSSMRIDKARKILHIDPTPFRTAIRELVNKGA